MPQSQMTKETTFCGNQFLLNSREAAKFLAISERSLWQFVKDGLITCVRMKRSVRFDIGDLKTFANQQKERGGTKLEPYSAADIAGVQNVLPTRGI